MAWRLLALALLPALGWGQDVGMSAMAVGVAGQVASVMMDKVQKKMADGETPAKCSGPQCCHSSGCMNIPGLRCDADRGPTRCVGASAFPPQKGQCACMMGACSPTGTCSSEGLPQTLEPAPAPAPTPATALQPSGGANGPGSWYSKGGPAPAPPGDDFSKWHINGPARLYAAPSGAAAVPPEDHTVALAAYAAAAAATAVGAAALVVRGVRSLRERRQPRAYEELLVLSGTQDGADANAAGVIA